VKGFIGLLLAKYVKHDTRLVILAMVDHDFHDCQDWYRVLYTFQKVPAGTFIYPAKSTEKIEKVPLDSLVKNRVLYTFVDGPVQRVH
jgi:hypothetical protein